MAMSISRRQLLHGAAVGVGAGLCLRAWAAEQAATTPSSATASQRYRNSAADWMMLKRQKPGALQLARDCGLDGVEVDMGPLGKRPDFENNLVNDEFRASYLENAAKLGLHISSLAMS